MFFTYLPFSYFFSLELVIGGVSLFTTCFPQVFFCFSLFSITFNGQQSRFVHHVEFIKSLDGLKKLKESTHDKKIQTTKVWHLFGTSRIESSFDAHDSCSRFKDFSPPRSQMALKMHSLHNTIFKTM